MASSEEYIRSEINNLRNIARLNGFSDTEIDKCLQKSYENDFVLVKLTKLLLLCLKKLAQITLILLLFTCIAYFFISCHNPTKRFFSKYVQGLIYPFMRFLRLSTLPFHDFLHASHLYQESCLISNPFYKEPQIDCWPCQEVNFVMDLSGFKNMTSSYSNSGFPFILREAAPSIVTMSTIQQLYEQNIKDLNLATYKFLSNIPTISSPEEINFDFSNDPFTHYEWCLNKVSSAHLLRRIFPRPTFIPKETEVALQKFLFLDGPQAEVYSLPMTDFANVWLSQGYGHRLIILEPSPQCQGICSTVSIVLQTRDILFYNWQFWRPISYPINATKEMTITFMGSFY